MSTKPETITGGCLCGEVRYTITLPPDYAWPPTKNGTCQCTMCRKITGSLIQNGLTVPNSSLSPPFATQPSYTNYASSATAKRGFCKTCGSSLTFTFNDRDDTEILLGTVDEKILRSDVGTALCDARNHGWCENAIKGVTDNLKGEMRAQ